MSRQTGYIWIRRFKASGFDEWCAVTITVRGDREDRRARIADDSGSGSSRNWLGVTALRLMVDVARSEQARRLEESLADDDLIGMPALGPGLAGARRRFSVLYSR